MRRFILADGDVFFQKPSLVSAVYGTSRGYQFYIVVGGLRRMYRSQWKVEAERERARLIAFDWEKAW